MCPGVKPLCMKVSSVCPSAINTIHTFITHYSQITFPTHFTLLTHSTHFPHTPQSLHNPHTLHIPHTLHTAFTSKSKEILQGSQIGSAFKAEQGLNRSILNTLAQETRLLEKETETRRGRAQWLTNMSKDWMFLGVPDEGKVLKSCLPGEQRDCKVSKQVCSTCLVQ